MIARRTLNAYSSLTRKGKLTACNILFSFNVCSICLSFTTWQIKRDNMNWSTNRTYTSNRKLLYIYFTSPSNPGMQQEQVIMSFLGYLAGYIKWHQTFCCMFQPTFCLSSIFMAKYCSVPLCFTSMTLPNEPVPRVFNLSKSSRHVVLCGNNNVLAYDEDEAIINAMFNFIVLTCGGHSHFFKKSSLALARNSFTKKEKQCSKTQLAYASF